MTEHSVAVLPAPAPESWDRLAPHRIRKFRAQCSCGWKGITAEQDWAADQARRHLRLATGEPPAGQPGDRQ